MCGGRRGETAPPGSTLGTPSSAPVFLVSAAASKLGQGAGSHRAFRYWPRAGTTKHHCTDALI